MNIRQQIVSSVLHALLMTWFWLTAPRGFTLLSRLFLEQQVLPFVLVVVSWLVVCSLVWRLQLGVFCTAVLFGFWLGVGVILTVFLLPGAPIHVTLAAVLLIIWLLVRVIGRWRTVFRLFHLPMSRFIEIVGLLTGLSLMGAFTFLAQAGPAQTSGEGKIPAHLLSMEWEPITDRNDAAGTLTAYSAPIQIGFEQNETAVLVQMPQGTLNIFPAMQFFSMSRNGLWAVWGNREANDVYIEQVQQSEWGDTAVYRLVWLADSPRAWLNPGDLKGEVYVEQSLINQRQIKLDITSVIHLNRQINAHHARYFDLVWLGNAPIQVRIGEESPVIWNPTSHSYPFGKPATFLSASETEVLLLRASSAEKGPFTELARFPLADPSFKIMEAQQPVCEFVLEGFVEQASKAESPTAGGGVATNIIYMQATRFIEDQPTGVEIGYSLAETGLGRGAHAVGTAPGTYISQLHLVCYIDE